MTPRTLPTTEVNEQQFQKQILELAHIYGYKLVNHTRRSRGKNGWATTTSVVGWPDLELVGRGQVLHRELKTDKGKVDPAQVDVLNELRANGADARVWRPADLHDGTVVRELLGQHRKATA